MSVWHSLIWLVGAEKLVWHALIWLVGAERSVWHALIQLLGLKGQPDMPLSDWLGLKGQIGIPLSDCLGLKGQFGMLLSDWLVLKGQPSMSSFDLLGLKGQPVMPLSDWLAERTARHAFNRHQPNQNNHYEMGSPHWCVLVWQKTYILSNFHNGKIDIDTWCTHSRDVIFFIRHMTLSLFESFKQSKVNVDMKLVSDFYVANIPGCRQLSSM